MKVRKAVFPVAGLGTRFLPATKAMPKEMLPVVDKPLIQYAVEEALSAGIEQLIFVTGKNKEALEDHFDSSWELEQTLMSRGKDILLKELVSLVPESGTIVYTRQSEPLGLGHAIWCARHIVGKEPFAVLLADDLIRAHPSVLSQMLQRFAALQASMAAVIRGGPGGYRQIRHPGCRNPRPGRDPSPRDWWKNRHQAQPPPTWPSLAATF